MFTVKINLVFYIKLVDIVLILFEILFLCFLYFWHSVKKSFQQVFDKVKYCGVVG